MTQASWLILLFASSDIIDIPYVNTVRTVKMSTTLFLCDEDVITRYTVSSSHKKVLPFTVRIEFICGICIVQLCM